MVNKLIGYILLAVGAILFALSFPTVRALTSIPTFGLKDLYFMIIGTLLLVGGAYLAFSNSGSKKQIQEVPIYEGEGKKRVIVGYKKMK